jgi:hypothetical protein
LKDIIGSIGTQSVTPNTNQSEGCSSNRKTRFAPDGKKLVVGVADLGPASTMPAATQALFLEEP